MPTPQKEQVVEEMAEKFTRASSIFLADFTGIDVNKINMLRKKFHESNVEYRIVKNTLAKLSMEKAGISDINQHLTGVNSYVISYDDPGLPIKVVEKLQKELEEKFIIKAGYFEGEIIGPDKVKEIAQLPAREQLLSKVLGTLQAPLSNFVGTLQANITNFMGLLKSLEAKNKDT